MMSCSDQASDELSSSTCFAWMDLNHIINSRGKNDWHMLCPEWREISLTVLLVNCHDVTGRIFDLWISHQTGIESPLKWHNQPGKKNQGLLESPVKIASSLQVKAMFTLHRIWHEKLSVIVWRHLSDMWLSPLEIGAPQPRFDTEIAPRSPFLCVNRGPLQCGFRPGAKDILYRLKIAWVNLKLFFKYCYSLRITVFHEKALHN